MQLTLLANLQISDLVDSEQEYLKFTTSKLNVTLPGVKCCTLVCLTRAELAQ